MAPERHRRRDFGVDGSRWRGGDHCERRAAADGATDRRQVKPTWAFRTVEVIAHYDQRRLALRLRDAEWAGAVSHEQETNAMIADGRQHGLEVAGRPIDRLGQAGARGPDVDGATQHCRARHEADPKSREAVRAAIVGDS